MHNFKDFKFTSSAGEEVSYKDVVEGRFKVSCEEDERIIAALGGIGWEYGGFTDNHLGEKGRTHESEYLNEPRKQSGTRLAFDAFEKAKGKLDENSKVIEIGCNMARNLREAHERYGSFCVGTDINPEVIAKNSEHFKDKGEFFVSNLRDGGKALKRFKDNEFDLGISCGFLMHVAANENKKILIKEMLRICKDVWFSEWLASDGLVQKEYTDMGGCTTSEDLLVYDDRLYHVPEAIQPNQQMLYFNRRDENL